MSQPVPSSVPGDSNLILWTSWPHLARHLPAGTNTSVGRWAHSSLIAHFPTGYDWIEAIRTDPNGVEATLRSGDTHSSVASARRRLGALWAALTRTPLPAAFVFGTFRASSPRWLAETADLFTEQELRLFAPTDFLPDMVKACLFLGKPFREWTDKELAEIQELKQRKAFSSFFFMTRLHAIRSLLQTSHDLPPHDLPGGHAWISIGQVAPVLCSPRMGTTGGSQLNGNLLATTCANMAATYPDGHAWCAAMEVSVKRRENRHESTNSYELLCGIAWAALHGTPVPAAVVFAAKYLPWLRFGHTSGLLTDAEVQLLSQPGPQRDAIVKYCLVFGKPFREWTSAEVQRIPLPQDVREGGTGSQGALSPWLVNDLRVILGYDHSRPRYKKRKTMRDEIGEQAPTWSVALDSWEAFLTAQGYADSTLEARLRGACRWIRWNLRRGTNTARAMTELDLNAWYHTCCPSRSDCYAVRDLLAWGTKARSPLFPERLLSLPLEITEALDREIAAQFRNGTGHGRGTSLDDVKTFLRAVYRMPTESETDEVSRQLVLLMACTGQRLTYYLDLEADCVVDSVVAPGLLTIASGESLTKQKTLNATNVVLDEELGHATVHWLRSRITSGNFRLIENDRNHRTYLHLFSLSSAPHVLLKHHVKQYVTKVKRWARLHMAAEMQKLAFDDLESTCHSLRHLLIGLVLAETKNQDIAQAVGNHLNSTQNGQYQRGLAAQTMLIAQLNRLYRERRVTGGFFVQMLAAMEAYAENQKLDDMMSDLFTAMTFEEYLVKYGRPTALGLCMKRGNCEHMHRCWTCIHQIFRREDIANALLLLKELWSQFVRFLSSSMIGNGTIPAEQRNGMLGSHLLVIKSVLQRLLDLDVPMRQILDDTLPPGLDTGALLAEFQLEKG